MCVHRAMSQRRLRSVCALYLLCLGVVNGVASRAQAQVLIALLFGEKLSTETFQLGVNASMAATGFRGQADDVRLDWMLSIYGEIRLHERFHLQPELALKYPSGGENMRTSVPAYPFTPYGEPVLDEVVAEGRVERHLRYLALPVFGKTNLGPVGLGVGPQVAVLIGAEDTVHQKDDGTRISLSRSVTQELRRVDAGLVASVDYAFFRSRKMRSLRLRLKGYLGLVDTIKDNPGDAVRNWNVMVGLDIPIGGTPKKTPPVTL